MLSNSVLINWGSNAQGVVKFPLAFTTKMSVVASPNGAGDNPGLHIQDISKTGFSYGNSRGWSMLWIAIGY